MNNIPKVYRSTKRALSGEHTNGENEIRRVLAIMPDGRTGAPCGACREFMTQLMIGKYHTVEIMPDYDHVRIVDVIHEWDYTQTEGLPARWFFQNDAVKTVHPFCYSKILCFSECSNRTQVQIEEIV